MGGSSWSDDAYNARVNTRAVSGTPTFAYTASVASGTVDAKVHDDLNPYGKIREARDSAAHPESLPIAVMFDVTGSMGGVPRVMQTKLPKLMGLIISKGYAAHPQILFGAIGDAFCDRAPLQVGQFESGVEMDEDLTKVFLEGGGGGQVKESYELALYFFAHKVKTDALEKRGAKGYLFITGDEHPYGLVNPDQVASVIGDTLGEPISLESIVRAVQEKWNVFFIIPKGTSYYDSPELRKHWQELLGAERVLMLADPEGVCELIGSTVGLCEGNVDIDGARSHLADHGTSGAIVHAVSNALAPLANSVALARAGTGDFPEGTGAGTARL